MQKKFRLRNRYLILRKKNYFEISPNFFQPINDIIKKKKLNKKKLNLSSYYPSFNEVNTLKLFETNFINKVNIFLPVIGKENSMHFYKWEKNNVLKINQFGMVEPALLIDKKIPDIMLLPLLAFDNDKNRLGYGGGFYDRYLKKHKEIITIGVAFSFQKYKKIPTTINDIKLNYILTDKGIIT